MVPGYFFEIRGIRNIRQWFLDIIFISYFLFETLEEAEVYAVIIQRNTKQDDLST